MIPSGRASAAVRPHACDNWPVSGATMKRRNRITGSLLLVAVLGSLALIVAAFIAHVPVRGAGHAGLRVGHHDRDALMTATGPSPRRVSGEGATVTRPASRAARPAR